MPSDEQRRGIKIVDKSRENREEELVGGIRNAIERGASIIDAQKSFVNAGYPIQEVASAARKVSELGISIKPVLEKKIEVQEVKTNKLPAPKPIQEKSSKKIFWITGTICLIILIGALLLGMFWGKFF